MIIQSCWIIILFKKVVGIYYNTPKKNKEDIIMISLKPKQQLELSFSPTVNWYRLPSEHRNEIVQQLSLLLLSNIGETPEKNRSNKEDWLCQEK